MVMFVIIAYSVYRTARDNISPLIILTNILLLLGVIICDRRYSLFSYLPYTRLAVIYTLVFTNGICIGELILNRRMMYNTYILPWM